MIAFVLDCSVTMSWCFEDEQGFYPQRILSTLKENAALAPGIWPLETLNALVVAERRKRITQADSERFLQLIGRLRIHVESFYPLEETRQILPLAREFGLSVYDAAYLRLAMKENLPLATLDQKLRNSAEMAGIRLF